MRFDIDLQIVNDSLFSAAGWATGDFNGDGVADVSDFNVWNSKHEDLAAIGVPEPSASVLAVWMVALTAFKRCRMRRHNSA